jgi:Tfp pilus assembly PilM family ATPase
MKASVAIEVSEKWLKVGVVRSSARGEQLTDWSIRSIAPMDDNKITRTIIGIFRELKLNPNQIIISLPRNLVTVRNVHLPSQDPTEIAQMIDLHIVRIVPYHKQDALWTHQRLEVDEIGHSKVLVAIVHRDVISNQIKMLASAGWQVDHVFLSSSGILESILERHKSSPKADELCLALDIDSTITDLIMFSGKKLLSSRYIPLLSNQLADRAGCAKLASEIKQSLRLFEKEEPRRKPVRTYLSGASACFSTLGDLLKQELGIPVINLDISPAIISQNNNVEEQKIAKDVSLSAVTQLAGGLSRPRLSFVPPELEIRRMLKQKTRELLLLGGTCLYLLIVICGIFVTRMYQQQSYLEALEYRYEEVSSEIGDLVSISDKVQWIRSYIQDRQIYLEYLAQLHRIIPSGLAIRFLSINEENQGVVRGQANRLSDIFKLISALEEMNLVGDIQTKYTRKKTLRESGVNRDITEFELGLQILPDQTGYSDREGS